MTDPIEAFRSETRAILAEFKLELFRELSKSFAEKASASEVVELTKDVRRLQAEFDLHRGAATTTSSLTLKSAHVVMWLAAIGLAVGSWFHI